jgi:hypothetical protein
MSCVCACVLCVRYAQALDVQKLYPPSSAVAAIKAISEASTRPLTHPQDADAGGVWCIADPAHSTNPPGPNSEAEGDRDAKDTWHCCLALMLYYLTDVGVLKCDMEQSALLVWSEALRVGYVLVL